MSGKYRIHIEELEPAEESMYGGKVEKETSGFVLLHRDGKGWGLVCMNLGRFEIGAGIATVPTLYESALLARGMVEAQEYHTRQESKELKNLFSISLDKLKSQDGEAE